MMVSVCGPPATITCAVCSTCTAKHTCAVHVQPSKHTCAVHVQPSIHVKYMYSQAYMCSTCTAKHTCAVHVQPSTHVKYMYSQAYSACTVKPGHHCSGAVIERWSANTGPNTEWWLFNPQCHSIQHTHLPLLSIYSGPPTHTLFCPEVHTYSILHLHHFVVQLHFCTSLLQFQFKCDINNHVLYYYFSTAMSL